MSNEFQAFLQSKGIISQCSCPLTPQQNGVAERKNRHLLDVVRTLLLESSIPPRFWCEALSTSVHLINRLPSPTLNHVSSFFKLFGHSPSYSDLRAFGCVCFVHLPSHERHKLTAQSVKCAFLVMLSLKRVMFVMIPMLVVYGFLGMWFSLKINISFHLMLSFHMHLYLFYLAFLIPRQLWKGSNMVLCMKRHESGSTSSVPPPDLDPAPDPAPASTTLRQSTRPSRPPDWYGFSSHVSLVAHFIFYFHSLLLQTGHGT